MGRKSGVAKKIRDLQPKALETHCYGHSLNLSVKDVTSQSKILNDTMGTVSEICILVKYSPKRERMLGEIQSNIEGIEDTNYTQGVITIDKLCPTRWTVKANCFKKVLDLYDQLWELFQSCLAEGKLVTDVKSRIIGCQSQMTNFKFFYGLQLGYTLYALTDNLSKAMQSKKMSAISSQRLANLTIPTIEKMRSENSASLFFESVVQKAGKHHHVEGPSVSRKRKTPNYSILQYVHGYQSSSKDHQPSTPEQQYRVIYYEAINLFVCSLKERFHQPTYQVYVSLENILICGIHDKEIRIEDKNILETYNDDLDVSALSCELQILRQMCKDTHIECFHDILSILSTNTDEKRLIPNVVFLCL